jgi:DNA polymerase alpha subunit A
MNLHTTIGIDMGDVMDIDEEPKVKSEAAEAVADRHDIEKPAAGHAELEENGTPAWLAVYDSLSMTTADTLEPLATSSTSTTSKDVSVLEG